MVEQKQEKQKMIDDMNVQELKALHYDVMLEMEQRRQVIDVINQKIREKSNESKGTSGRT